jgi:hypothetical protein
MANKPKPRPQPPSAKRYPPKRPPIKLTRIGNKMLAP